MKLDLSTLPRHIIKLNKQWFKNTKTGKWIPTERITEHLPKATQTHEAIIEKRYDLKY